MHNVIEALSGCEPEIGRWLWALEDARRRTKRVLDGLTRAVIDWPHPLSPPPPPGQTTFGGGGGGGPLLSVGGVGWAVGRGGGGEARQQHRHAAVPPRGDRDRLAVRRRFAEAVAAGAGNAVPVRRARRAGSPDRGAWAEDGRAH